MTRNYESNSKKYANPDKKYYKTKINDDAFQFALEARVIKEFEKTCDIMHTSPGEKNRLWNLMNKKSKPKKS